MTAPHRRTEENRRQWQRKPVLRAIYNDLYRRMAAHCVPGRTLEVGGGSGNFKEFAGDVVASDVAFAPWLDLVADAQLLPLAAQSLANIVMVDVVHHVERPRAFFGEAARVLRPGGRIVMVEPGITAASWPFYRFLHQESVRMDADPLGDAVHAPARDAFDGNQAIPTLLVGRHRRRFAELFPNLRLHRVEWISLFAYPLSGGFKRWSLIPASLVAPMLRLEAALEPWLGRLLGFRLLIVIEAMGATTP
jgi:SAM-dependent methyltransferase